MPQQLTISQFYLNGCVSDKNRKRPKNDVLKYKIAYLLLLLN